MIKGRTDALALLTSSWPPSSPLRIATAQTTTDHRRPAGLPKRPLSTSSQSAASPPTIDQGQELWGSFGIVENGGLVCRQNPVIASFSASPRIRASQTHNLASDRRGLHHSPTVRHSSRVDHLLTEIIRLLTST